MPETARTKPGALASLRPRVHVPRAARATFVAVTPVNIASWSLGGFYFSLMPAVVRAATGTTLPIVGGLVVATLTFSGAVAVVVLRKLVPEKMLILGIVTLAFGVLITLAGVQYQNVGVMLFATVVAGPASVRSFPQRFGACCRMLNQANALACCPPISSWAIFPLALPRLRQ